MQYKYTHEETEFNEVNFAPKRRSCGQEVPGIDVEVGLLYPNGRKISQEKAKDLKERLPYIPPVHHSFYKS
jgi:hypothetical protein